MKELTRAEEQIMHILWRLKKGFLKDIYCELKDPRPAYTTVSTVIRVLVKKGFVGFKTYGKVNEYFPLVPKKEYFRRHLKNLVGNFFNHSFTHFTAFFAQDEELELQDLEALREILQKEIEKRKEDPA